ncbi:PIG-L family deacetylase [Allosaccharopolyspora coralli]|uniref:PIG-L family deacetylase n=1 Tax=Allosaccharopolyspora coralli TaxID=2665642 RepID=A0A5Q3QDL0_9PSEU|nr:PIG-L deacetylase family protein [Allosaccharopolyspora coralli]QGK71446.1 PIG-L family deacetylase [Allosaccharopolyspora coralli]
MRTSPKIASDVRQVLVVTAHPDDVDFGTAGTVASWRTAGVGVTYCVCSSGEAGATDGLGGHQLTLDEMRTLRENEQRSAARAVGVDDVRFLGHPDGRLVADLTLRRDITRVIRAVRPDRVVAHSPEINWGRLHVSHPDHRAVGEATVAAVYPDSRTPLAHPELVEDGLQPWTVHELWLTEAPDERINHAVDVTDHYEAKLAALHAHHSQTAHLDGLGSMIREHLRSNAEQHGLSSDRLAEAFQVVSTA